jgi:arsenite methyltransferase
VTSGTSHGTDRKLDRWADWLVRGRDRGAMEVQIQRTRRSLARVRDRVLRGARLRPGERVVDLGAGTGLLALEVRRRVKGSGYVVAIDVSADALSECRGQAGPAQNVAPLACVLGDALHIPLASQSVDVVTTRSVLIYLADKQAGVRELYRVLKPRGRVSIFEPINEVSEQVRNRVRASGFYNELQPEWGEIRKYYDAHAKDWWGTLIGWDEREVIGWFEAAGFSSLKVSYELMSGLRAKKPRKALRERSLEIVLTTTLNGTCDSSSMVRDRDQRRPPSTSWPSDELATHSPDSECVRPRVPLLFVYAAACGAGVVLLVLVATGRLAYREERAAGA